MRNSSIMIAMAVTMTLALPVSADSADKNSKIYLSNAVPCVVDSALPRAFGGHNILSITKELTGLAKDEYESTNAYQRRLESAKKSYASLLDPLCFMIPEANEHPSIFFKYDADAEAIKVDLQNSILNHYFSSFYIDKNPSGFNETSVLRVEEVINDKSQYTGSNAFGVEAHVTRTESDWYELFLRLKNPTISIPIQPDIARDSREHLGMLLVVKLEDPYLVKTHHIHTATLDAPYSESGDTYWLQAQLSEVILYDQRSLQVIGRAAITPNSKNAESMTVVNGVSVVNIGNTSFSITEVPEKAPNLEFSTTKEQDSSLKSSLILGEPVSIEEAVKVLEIYYKKLPGGFDPKTIRNLKIGNQVYAVWCGNKSIFGCKEKQALAGTLVEYEVIKKRNDGSDVYQKVIQFMRKFSNVDDRQQNLR